MSYIIFLQSFGLVTCYVGYGRGMAMKELTMGRVRMKQADGYVNYRLYYGAGTLDASPETLLQLLRWLQVYEPEIKRDVQNNQALRRRGWPLAS